MKIMESDSDQITAKSQLRDELGYLKLQWVSARDESLKKDLSEKIKKRLTSTN